ncbi:hypothetical protein DGMP_26550 [Desulfomarina profundi]|uniref:CARDB domain-containing protein n=1 Tax=Desulfomarina profundi TaxID=2772557 RepID=A0A8D5FHZ8_9BACT|nr:hypothetical protein [Desulfomarina profundi]BCL61962.1 hypothetical protein DGMP_26550 [Desulfomarina profundi]
MLLDRIMISALLLSALCLVGENAQAKKQFPATLPPAMNIPQAVPQNIPIPQLKKPETGPPPSVPVQKTKPSKIPTATTQSMTEVKQPPIPINSKKVLPRKRQLLPPVGKKSVLSSIGKNDYSIKKLEMITAGPGKGRIAITIKATTITGKKPSPQPYPLRLKKGNRTVWQGTGKIKRMSFGWGDKIVTSYVPPAGTTRLKAEVNVFNMRNRVPELTGRTANNTISRNIVRKVPQGKTVKPVKSTIVLADSSLKNNPSIKNIRLPSAVKKKITDRKKFPEKIVPIGGGASLPAANLNHGDLSNLAGRERNLPRIDPEAIGDIVNDSWGSYWGELEIIDMRELRGGPNSHKIAITISAKKVFKDYPRNMPYKVLLKNGTEVLWEGTGHVKNILFGWGDYIVTDYIAGEAIMLEAVINPRNSDGSFDYQEYDTRRGNTLSKPFHWQRFRGYSAPGTATERVVLTPREPETERYGLRLINIRREQEGPDWSRIKVTYDLPKTFRQSGGRCTFSAYGAEGRSRHETYRNSRVQCIPAPVQTTRRVPVGRLQQYEFTCRVSPGVFGVEPFIAGENVELLCESPRGGQIVKIGLGQKQWTPRASVWDQWGPTVDDIEDLFIPFAYIEGRNKPRVLRLNVSNARPRAVTRVPVRVELVRAGAVVETLNFELPAAGLPYNPRAGDKLLNIEDGSGWEWAEVEDGRLDASWINITVDPDSQIRDSSRRNNHFRVDVSGFYPKR